jgi:hypothetical protein
MRFTLIYDGPLPAQSARDSRLTEKHYMREQFHSQLADLWANHPALKNTFSVWQQSDQSLPESTIYNPNAGPTNSRSPILPFRPQQVGKNYYISLVSDLAALTCELDILFLRKEDKGHLVNQAGDLDNRIKVLFDSLRSPLNESELPNNVILPKPFFVLLEDDRLITRVNVTSERLLEGPIATSKNHVRLVINEFTRARELTWINLGLGD